MDAHNVLDWLDRAASANPNGTAFGDEAAAVSFLEARERIERIGSSLARSLGELRQPIVCMVDRDVQSIVSALGIVASGNFYVPLDASMPGERLASMLAQVRPLAIVVHGDAALESISVPPHIQVIEYETAVSSPIDADALAAIRCALQEDDPLYAICTSGSTGVPKVVLKSHRSILSFIPTFVKTFGFNEGDSFANQAPFDFDVSAKDIYTALYCAAPMHVIPRVCFAMPKLLGPYLNERHVTCCIWAVSALCVVAQLKAFKRERPESIRLVLFSGEVMPPKHLDTWRSWYPEATFVNLYAPSEVTGNCLYHIVGTGEGPDGRLPLGIPFDNCEVLVLRKDYQPVAPEELGEIYVRCPHLALGYYRDPERTAASFVQNPTNDAWPQIVYKTGDIARLGSDGHYYFAGRKDFQIKHMGHRIELEELELHLNGVDGVDRACCAFDTIHNKIVAYYEGTPDTKDIVAALNHVLPKYMIPNVFKKLDALPVNARGKIDRQQLRKLLESPAN